MKLLIKVNVIEKYNAIKINDIELSRNRTVKHLKRMKLKKGIHTIN